MVLCQFIIEILADQLDQCLAINRVAVLFGKSGKLGN